MSAVQNMYKALTIHIKPRSALRSLMGGIFLLLLFAISGPFVHRFANADFLIGSDVRTPINLRSVPVSLPVSFMPAEYARTFGTDKLVWDASPDAVTYNVYHFSEKMVSGITTTNYLIPPDTFWNFNTSTFTVTAVTADGRESIPSNITFSRRATVPGSAVQTDPTKADTPRNQPSDVVVTPQWNLGKPQMLVVWLENRGWSPYYNVYRDGVQVATNMTTLYYIDTNVKAGESHSYAISAFTDDTLIANQESAQSTAVTAVALSAQPTLLAQKVNVTGVQRNDDSATVYFDPIDGVTDYRIYKLITPNNVKYMGAYFARKYPSNCGTTHGPYCGTTPAPYAIELNNIDVTNGNDVVVEAVDKFGPFQTMDGPADPAPGSMVGGVLHMTSNGQGDPSNVPNVVASSAVFHVTAKARSLTGGQAFFDNFRGEQPLTKMLDTSVDPQTLAFQKGCADPHTGVCMYQNDKWNIFDFQGDHQATKFFFMNNHFMDLLYDGNRNNDAGTVMMPRQTVDISGGKIAHFTMEVDAHNNGRRWSDIFVTEAGQPLVRADPSKITVNCNDLSKPCTGTTGVTPALNEVVWAINEYSHNLDQYLGRDSAGSIVDKSIVPSSTAVNLTSRTAYTQLVGINGSNADLDKRHTFDMYISQSRVRIYEAGKLIEDSALAQPLPYTKIQFYANHEVYHTSNDVFETVSNSAFDDTPSDYWYNHRPYADERHWDNMGQEVLTDWSQATPTILAVEPPVFTGGPTPTPTPVVTPTPTPRPTATPLTVALCITMPAQPVTPSSLNITASDGSSVSSLNGLRAVNGTLTITDPTTLTRITDSATYTVTVTPAGYLPLKVQTAHLLSQCAILPPSQPLLSGDFNGDKKIDLSDIITMIRVINSPQANSAAEQAVRAVFGAQPTLSNLISVIRNYQTSLQLP